MGKGRPVGDNESGVAKIYLSVFCMGVFDNGQCNRRTKVSGRGCVRDVVEKNRIPNRELKWPNDVQMMGQKICVSIGKVAESSVCHVDYWYRGLTSKWIVPP